MLRLIIQPAPQPPVQEPFDGLAKSYIPMLFSGVVTAPMVRDNEGVGLKLSEMTRRRLIAYDPDGDLPPEDVSLQRFRIDYHQTVAELMPDPGASLFHSQYAQQRPTWYSGAMAEVMQIVGGYGRQDLPALPEDTIERARLSVPETRMRRMREELGEVRLPGYTGLPPATGQFQYDYKFNNTHGVGFDNKGKPWLLRVSNAGVYAMPLPLIPVTTTPAFREYMEDKGDDEILAIIDRFGGMPSGESFPVLSEAFQAWRRAGVIIKVCDVADFYQHAMYSSACGWSFNTRGSEGFNTCYDYDEDGVGYGLAYKMRLSLAAADNEGRLQDGLNVVDPVELARLNAYLSALYRAVDSGSATDLAIRYKLHRVPVADVLDRAHRAVTESEVDYWDNLELAPIATHSGSVTQTAKGYLWHPAKFEFQPQIKFPEPFMDACISHDFGPAEHNAVPDGYIVRCNTIMFGYYVGDQLKVVKYYLDQRQYQRQIEDDFEECMIVGSWTRTITTGMTSLLGHFYTTDFDERHAAAPVTEVINIVGKDLGYDSQPFFSYDNFFWRPGTLWRNRYFSSTTTSNKSSGYNFEVAVCIPFLCRNALLHAARAVKSGSTMTKGSAMDSVRDPTSYRYWTHDSVFAWIGGLPVQKGVPYPKDGNPVWVEIENYDPGGCSDFADQGPWIPALPADYTWLIHPIRNEWKQSGGGGPPSFRPTSESSTGPATDKRNLQISILDQTDDVHDHPDNTYFLASPDEFVGMFYRDACRVVFGEAIYANVSEADGERRKRYGHTRLADHKAAHHFIGVING